MIFLFSSLLLLFTSVFTQGFNNDKREMNQTVGNVTTRNQTRRNSLLPLWITLGVFLFIILLIIIIIAVLLYMKKKHKVGYNKITAICPFINKLLRPLSQNPDTKRIVTDEQKKSDTAQLEKALNKIKMKPEENIAHRIKMIVELISTNCNVDYAAEARKKDAVKILYDVLMKNNDKKILESTIVCLTKLMEGSDEFKKIAKDTGTLKIFDDFLYKYNSDADLALKMFNFLQLFVDSPDLPKEALLQCGIVQTILNYSLEKEQDKTWESTLRCLSGLSESVTTDENKLIEKLFKRFISNNAVIIEEKNQRLIYLSVKIIYDLTKNIERNKEETSKHFKELFNQLTNLSNDSLSRELISKIIRNCILDSKPRFDLFVEIIDKKFWTDLAMTIKESDNLVIRLNCLWIATKLIIEIESSRSELKTNRNTVQKDLVYSFVECLQKYSIASEMTDEKWEIIGKTFTACQILDNDVIMQFSEEIETTIRNLTENSRFDTDNIMRDNVESFITASRINGLGKVIVKWSETKKEMLAKPENHSEKSLIEYWRSK